MGCGASRAVEVESGHEAEEEVTSSFIKAASSRRSSGSSSSTPSGEDSDASRMPRRNRLDSCITTVAFTTPLWTKTRKHEIFSVADYVDIDKRAVKCPMELLYKPFRELADYLTEDAENEVQKVRACFTWLCSVDVGALLHKIQSLPESGTPLDFLLRINWQMANHANVFYLLCQAADLVCHVVSGINKSAAYQVGAKLDQTQLSAQWNAVLVEDEWRLCDLFWASTCVVGKQSGEWALLAADGELEGEMEEDDHIETSEGETMHRVNEFFFLTDPDQLICTHFPLSPKWQLLREPFSYEKFENYVYVRERFFDMGVKMADDSKTESVVKTEKGEIQIKFDLDKDVSKFLQFRFLLYRAKEVSRASIACFPLERYVFYHKSDTSIEYNVTFPVSGRFKMDLFGRDTERHENFDLVCSYMIECPLAARDADPLPDNPDIGWGPGVESEKAGLIPKSHEDGVIDSSDGKIEIRFECKEDALNLLHYLRHNDLSDFLLQKYAIARIDGQELVINMKLPQGGLYAFKLFADEPKPKAEDLPNVCNYLIKVTNSGVKNDPYPELHGGILGRSPMAQLLNVKSSEEYSLVQPDDNRIQLDFEADDSLELLCQITHKSLKPESLRQTVQRTTSDTGYSFVVKLPQQGEYGINIFARYKDDPSRIYQVHSCKADYNAPAEESLDTIQEEPDVVVIDTWKDEATIEQKKACGQEVLCEFFKEGAQEKPEKHRVQMSEVDGEQVFKAKVAELGAYRLTVFGSENGILQESSIYSICRREPYPEEVEEEQLAKEAEAAAEMSPEQLEALEKRKELERQVKAIKQQIHAAIAKHDHAALAEAIAEAQELGLKGDPDVKKGQQVLDYATCTELLTEAMTRRDQKMLERALQEVARAGLQQKMSLQLQMARKILEQLKRLELLRHEVLNLDSKAIAEIKSYNEPPDEVHKVMAASYLLLGEPPSKVKDWRAVQVLINKTGRGSLKRRIKGLDLNKVDLQNASTARIMLLHFTKEQVQNVSVNAATFFIWAVNTTEEVKARYEQNGGDFSKIRPKSGVFKRMSVVP